VQPAFLSGQAAGEPPVRILGYLEGGHQFAGGALIAGELRLERGASAHAGVLVAEQRFRAAAEHAEQPCNGRDAHRIQQPALAVLGTASPAMFAERQKLLLHWLPNAEPLDLPGLTHLLHAQEPAAVAHGLTGFFARHPIPESL